VLRNGKFYSFVQVGEKCGIIRQWGWIYTFVYRSVVGGSRGALGGVLRGSSSCLLR